MSTKFAGGVAEDVCQVNWNWLYNYSGNGQTFIDLNSVSEQRLRLHRPVSVG